MTKRKKCPICNSLRYQIIYRSTFQQKHLNPAIFSARRLPDKVHGTIVKCLSCNLCRTLEIVEAKKLARLYKNSSFTYANLVVNLRSNYRKLLEDTTPYLNSRSSFLEIGCGSGFVLEEARKMKFKKVVGVEPSTEAASRAKSSIRNSILVSTLKQKLLPKSNFDLVVAFQVFDHIADPNKFLKICHGLLKKNGIMLLMNHDVNSLTARIMGEKSPIFDIEHTYLYSKDTISKILIKNNFRILKIYNPTSIFSLSHLFRLLPLPLYIKKLLGNFDTVLSNVNVLLSPGNLSAIVRKC